MKAITYFHIRNTPGFQSILFNLGMIIIFIYINPHVSYELDLFKVLLYLINYELLKNMHICPIPFTILGTIVHLRYS